MCLLLTLSACARVTVVGLSVYLCVCRRSSASVRCMCNKLNLPVESLLNSQGFQLADFAKKLSFSSYSLFFVSHGQVSHLQLIEVEVHDKFV